jgi:hypothetical protein
MWRTQEAYACLGDVYQTLIQSRVNIPAVRLLAASARCAMLHIANSHGGGIAYNELLIPLFLEIEPALVADLVLEHRCNDSIGTTHHLNRDRNDRQRAAFTIAWRRGLYLAAYSITPAF